MDHILDDIEKFIKNDYNKKFEKIYKNFPKTMCDGCGTCCYDPPDITYVEFLFLFEYFLNLDLSKIEVLGLFKEAYKTKLYSLIKPSKCMFLDDNNFCIIHDASPFSCKRWGLQSRESHNQSIRNADEYNREYDRVLKENYGIINREDKMLEYCTKVSVLDGKRDVNFKETYAEIIKIELEFNSNPRKSIDINSYALISFFKEQRVFFDMIRQTKKYQAGDKQAIEEYVSTIDFEKPLKVLLSHFE